MDKNLVILNEIKEMDKELAAQLANVPFDKGLPVLQDKLWKIANRHGTTGAEVLKMYMDYKNNQ
ncbi:hypothetical protein [uncultured Clostridium sp.]|jgi:hypothetical protein|uniref:hypothetical protein n=1 Tax=uncultured Clostridium sp. TaxID=59620 RepID=UPI0025EC34ED|nr:hypothetical protein [uncultured Clostridium sp.]